MKPFDGVGTASADRGTPPLKAEFSAAKIFATAPSYLVEGGELFTRIADSADDAAGIARLLGLPETADDAAVEGLLVAALKAADYRPYALLTRDLGGFRRWVSRLHAAWAAESFRRLGLLDDLLPPAA